MPGFFDFLGGMGGSIAARQIQNDSYTSQQRQMEEVYNRIKTLPIPDEEKMRLLLEVPKLVGNLAPEQLAALNLGPSEIAKIGPAETREAQLAALKQLQGLSETGLSQADLAAMRQLTQQTEAKQKSDDAALMQQMAQRGMGGGGAELALRALNSQQATNRLANQSDDIAQTAQARALQALTQSANLSGQVRSQDYQEELNRAQAIDAINKYNTMNQQQVASTNTQANNQAQQFNLQNAQNIANAGTQTRNQQQQYNSQLPQLTFQNNLSKYNAMLRPAEDLTNIEANRGKANAGYALGMGQAIGGLGSKIFGMNQGGVVPHFNDGGVVAEENPNAQPVEVVKDSQANSNPAAMSADNTLGAFEDKQDLLGPLMSLAFAKNGGVVPGQALVEGNSIKNDIVPVMASPGEIFIPRTHSQDIESAKQFLNDIFRKKEKGA